MIDGRDSDERAARRAQAHAFVDAVLDVDPATAPGPALTYAIESHAQLAAIMDGAVVAIMPTHRDVPTSKGIVHGNTRVASVRLKRRTRMPRT